MSLLGDAMLDHWTDLFAEAGSTAIYDRNGTTATINVVKGSRFTERWGDDSVYGTTMKDDFLVRSADLVAAGFVLPEILDRIEWTDEAGTPRFFQVSSEGSERHYDPMDQFGHLLRIHTAEQGE